MLQLRNEIVKAATAAYGKVKILLEDDNDSTTVILHQVGGQELVRETRPDWERAMRALGERVEKLVSDAAQSELEARVRALREAFPAEVAGRLAGLRAAIAAPIVV